MQLVCPNCGTGNQGFREVIDEPNLNDHIMDAQASTVGSFEECPECLIQYLGKEKYCATCGTPLVNREVPESKVSSDKSKSAKSMVMPFIGVLVAIFAVYFLVSPDNVDSSTGDMSSNQISTTATEDFIPASEAVGVFSEKLGINVQPEDLGRLQFPDVSSDVDFYSGQDFSLLVYPSYISLEADKSNFIKNYNEFSSSQSWESCKNVVAIFNPSEQQAADLAVGTWCTSPSVAPSGNILDEPARKFIRINDAYTVMKLQFNFEIAGSTTLAEFAQNFANRADAVTFGRNGRHASTSEFQDGFTPGQILYNAFNFNSSTGIFTDQAASEAFISQTTVDFAVIAKSNGLD